MPEKTIVIVGAGSASFGLSVLNGLLANETPLDRATIRLHDIDRAALERMEGLARFVVAERGLDRRIEGSIDPKEAFDGADCVILSVAVDREATWKADRERGLRHGIDHYAENGGPGALFHTARNLEVILPILRQMEASCPDAWLLNYTNPVTRICTAASRYSRIKSIGICHQIDFGYYMAGVLLHDELGIPLPRDYLFRWNTPAIGRSHAIAAHAKNLITIQAAGLNHFTFALAVTDRNGNDLYPLLRERNRTFDPAFEPLTRRVFELFGYFPVPGDTHLSEYLPFTHEVSRETFRRMDIQMYDFDWSRAERRQRAALARRVVAEQDVSLLDAVGSERAETVVDALLNRTPLVDQALNLPNRSAISNLPPDAIVEAPASFLAGTPRLASMGPLPPAIAELCGRQVLINELVVAGIVERDRAKLLQALALDPMVTDPDLPAALLDEV